MPSKHFQVHSGVLSQSIVLESQCQVLSSRDPKLSLPDVDPSIFELALCYMYGRNYGDYFSLGNPKPRKADADATAFQRHSLLYCFARKYQLSGLVVLTTKNIKALGRIEYQSVFAAAKQAYKKLPAEESWFRKCFKDETKRALMDDRELARESWVVDTIREENGNFASDIFTALMEGYEQIISSGIGIGPGSVSAQKLSRWFSPNLSRATDAHSIQSSSTDWTAGDTNSERDSNTDDLGDDEVVSVDGSSCVEDPTPAGESPCAVEAFPEVEPTCAVENASAAETLYPVEIAIRGEAPPYEEGPPQEEALADAPEEMADGDEVPASALEVEICSDEAVPEHLDECDIWETWNLMKNEKADACSGWKGLLRTSLYPSLRLLRKRLHLLRKCLHTPRKQRLLQKRLPTPKRRRLLRKRMPTPTNRWLLKKCVPRRRRLLRKRMPTQNNRRLLRKRLPMKRRLLRKRQSRKRQLRKRLLMIYSPNPFGAPLARRPERRQRKVGRFCSHLPLLRPI
jgi:hypothetical protein